MRIANSMGRATLVLDVDGVEHGVDIESMSGGLFSSDPGELFDRWDAFRHWGRSINRDEYARAASTLDFESLRPPSPRPRQVFAVGLNYGDHARESGSPVPERPLVFTKFVSSFSGPISTVELPEGNVDWEVELVVVIGYDAFRVHADDAWASVAGVTAGQDLSERVTQNIGPAPQFSMSKSFPGFSPQGPWLVTPDEFDDPDDIALGCSVNGSTVQSGRTRDLVFSVPQLIEHISATVPLRPGDVLFTGTPAGTALGRRPARFLSAGDELISWVDGVGTLHQTMAGPASRVPYDIAHNDFAHNASAAELPSEPRTSTRSTN